MMDPRVAEFEHNTPKSGWGTTHVVDWGATILSRGNPPWEEDLQNRLTHDRHHCGVR